jgi:putative cell wall-binding protein
VVKIDLDTFTRFDAITLNTGEDVLESAVIDPAGEFAYFGTVTSPGQVVKIDLDTFTRVDAITLPAGENFLYSAVIDPGGGFAYFGTGTGPAQVVKVDLATFERADAITLNTGENSFYSAVIDPAGDFAYFGTSTGPAPVVKIDLTSFTRVDAITLNTGENALWSAVIDPGGGFAYFGTSTIPGQVVKVQVHEPEVIRLAGANRFETAAAVSAHHYPGGAGPVFVATGTNFPDALAGATAAGLANSPLLLAGSIPPATSGELDRLDPDSLVILGGTAVISASDEAALGAWGTTERLAGDNRYQTAVEISKAAFGDGEADVVLVATGTNFPDALAAAAAGGELNGPVLLTPPDTLPAEVAAEIERLDPDTILVIGGTAAVSPAVFDALNDIKPTTRISGANRYATAVAISEHTFTNPGAVNRVYIAVGTNFPDALAGAAAAASLGVPVLLTPSDELPQSVIDEIQRLGPTRIYILGGTAVISTNVANQLEALLP